jgi:hypothetical protein
MEQRRMNTTKGKARMDGRKEIKRNDEEGTTRRKRCHKVRRLAD